MKKIFLTVIPIVLAFTSLCQVTNRVGKSKSADTTRKSKTSTVPISNMSNTVNTATNSALSNTSPTITTKEMNKPLTLEELNQKVINLQSVVDQLNKRLPYAGVAFLKIIVDNNNLSTTKNRVKIDNELCNGNPNAKIFLENNGTIRRFIFDNNYWYIESGWHINGIEPVIFETTVYPGNPDLNKVTVKPANKNSGVLLSQWVPFYIGESFNVIIVKDFPDYNPAIIQRSSTQ